MDRMKAGTEFVLEKDGRLETVFGSTRLGYEGLREDNGEVYADFCVCRGRHYCTSPKTVDTECLPESVILSGREYEILEMSGECVRMRYVGRNSSGAKWVPHPKPDHFLGRKKGFRKKPTKIAPY